MEEKHKEIMLYLKNIVNKYYVLTKRLDKIDSTLMALGRATGTAFNQTKVVINDLSLRAETIQDDLSDAMGTIRDSSYCDPCVRTRSV